MGQEPPGGGVVLQGLGGTVEGPALQGPDQPLRHGLGQVFRFQGPAQQGRVAKGQDAPPETQHRRQGHHELGQFHVHVPTLGGVEVDVLAADLDVLERLPGLAGPAEDVSGIGRCAGVAPGSGAGACGRGPG